MASPTAASSPPRKVSQVPPEEMVPPPYEVPPPLLPSPQRPQVAKPLPPAPRTLHADSASPATLGLDTFILTVCLGFTGAHWFYLGRPRWGWLYLSTFGLLGVGWALDMIRVPSLVSRSRDMDRFGDSTATVDLLDAYALCLCPLTGLILAAHHWVLKRKTWATLHVLSLGFLGFGWAVDLFRLPCLVREHNVRMQDKHLESLTAPYDRWVHGGV